MDNDSFSLSFELFPPSTAEGLAHLKKTYQDLYQSFNPHFFSVTFGASGYNQDKSIKTIQTLCNDHLPAVPHLTGIGLNHAAAEQYIQQYRDMQIKHLIVLRGDPPQETSMTPSDFPYANQLIAFIRKKTGKHFKITVAAHPEIHPESTNIEKALLYFKHKIEAGADAAITQYFYNDDAYWRFVENCEQIGIHVPIIPGIMPIRHFDRLVQFSNQCQAEIPRWLYKRLDFYKNDPKSLQAYGIDVVARLCEKLIGQGAPGLHFYTLNKYDPTACIIKNICHKHPQYIAPLLNQTASHSYIQQRLDT